MCSIPVFWGLNRFCIFPKYWPQFSLILGTRNRPFTLLKQWFATKHCGQLRPFVEIYPRSAAARGGAPVAARAGRLPRRQGRRQARKRVTACKGDTWLRSAMFKEGRHYLYTTLSQNRLITAQKQHRSCCRESFCRDLDSGCSNNDRF